MPNYFALVPAAGSGARFGAETPKQYLELARQPLIFHALAALCRCPWIAEVWVVLAAGDEWWGAFDWSALGGKLRPVFCGGATRAESVANGLAAMSTHLAADDWVLVHDAARPCLSAAMLDALFVELSADPVGGILAVPVADTLKLADAGQRVAETRARNGLWQAQTPQMFRFGVLRQALAGHPGVTDEAGAVEAAGLKPRLVRADASNLKVTFPADLRLAELILSGRDESGMKGGKKMLRVGQGSDIHVLAAGRKLIIGGVEIDHERGLLGHSDADVLLHALTDALLGAAGLGDIGRHFPDTDASYRGADSRVLLCRAHRLLLDAGWRIVNIDATINAQRPKMAPHIPKMTACIAADLGLSENQVNIKAKTAEKLGFVGREEGISCDAVALIESAD